MTAIFRPLVTPPVNAILLTLGCLTKGSPASGPYPVTILATPRGKASNISASARVESGVYSEGLITTVLPEVTAAATFQLIRSNG